MNYLLHKNLPVIMSASLLALCVNNMARAQPFPAMPNLQNYIAALPLSQLNNASGQTIKNKLQEKAQTTGKVRLIVTLRTPSQPEHLLNAVQLQMQRASLAAAQDAFAQRIASYGGTLRKKFTTLPIVVVEGTSATLDHLLNQSSDVKSIQEDALHQYNLERTIPLIGADKAWTAGATGDGQVVAVIDTGVRSSHPFLTGKVVHEACFSTPGETVDPLGMKLVLTSACPSGRPVQFGVGAAEPADHLLAFHGTAVAGNVAGTNSMFSGVAKGARIMSIKTAVIGNSEDGTLCDYRPAYLSGCLVSQMSDDMTALEYVYSQRNNFKIAAVNLSFGALEPGVLSAANCDDSPMKPFIDNLRSAGIATIVASGNDKSTNSLSHPACISSAISVGASTFKDDAVLDTSNSASFLTLLAPGDGIWTSVFGLEAIFGVKTDYYALNGTSMSAPLVAGAWAALKSKHPGGGVTDILNALVSTGKPITDSRNQVTKPRIQVDAALAKLRDSGCFTSSNATHIAAGRATAYYGYYAYANGSNQYIGFNNAFYTTKLRQTDPNYYVIDRSCP